MVGTYLSTITLNINELNDPGKSRNGLNLKRRHIKICFRMKNTELLKVKKKKKYVYANRNIKKAGVAILRSAKIDFKTRL